MNDRLLKLFYIMVQSKKVRITKELRKNWNQEDLGQWFQINSIDCFGLIEIQSEYHSILSGVKINELKF